MRSPPRPSLLQGQNLKVFRINTSLTESELQVLHPGDWFKGVGGALTEKVTFLHACKHDQSVIPCRVSCCMGDVGESAAVTHAVMTEMLESR